MAIGKIFPNKDIIYGGSVITPDPLSPYFYAPSNRIIDIPDTSSLAYFQDVNARYSADHWTLEGAVPVASGDTNSPSANADAVVYYAAPGTRRHHVVQGLAYGYNATPTSGFISIESPSGTPIFGPLPITTSDAQFEDFPRGFKAGANLDMLIRLTAAGSAVKGAVSAKGHRIE